jgi:hypothetical protein
MRVLVYRAHAFKEIHTLRFDSEHIPAAFDTYPPPR